MTSTRDVQDILGLPIQDDVRLKQSKRNKSDNRSKKGAEGSHWNKELKSLMGERAPPLPLASGPKWKDKRNKMMGPVRRWRLTPFKNDARTDELLLRHWQRSADEHMDLAAHNIHDQDEESERKHSDTQQPYRFFKYNQSTNAPNFTHEEYDEHLKSERWTEDETRYLMMLYEEFAGKWPLITDRYDYGSSMTSLRSTMSSQQQDADLTAQSEVPSSVAPFHRMEDLKARFYQIATKLTSLRNPQSQMTEIEYHEYELMTKFNPQHEIMRKKIKEQQMTRSSEEQREEQYLLAELKRIYSHQERFDAELRELRGRVDHSLTDGRPGGTTYTTSSELTQLFQRVAQLDKSKAQAAAQQKAASHRRSVDGSAIASLASAGSPTAATTFGANQKRGHATQEIVPGTRSLSTKDEARFGVSTHDRLASGVSFVSDKIAKARTATKSSVQNQKIASILAELSVPDIIQIQNSTICEEIEKLVDGVVALLKARQAIEKVAGERSVLVKQMEIEGLAKLGEYSDGGENGRLDDDDDDNGEQGAVEVEHGDKVGGDGQYMKGENQEAARSDRDDGTEQDVKMEEQPQELEANEQNKVSGRKRSASVLSAMSASSRSGRQRKGARKQYT